MIVIILCCEFPSSFGCGPTGTDKAHTSILRSLSFLITPTGEWKRKKEKEKKGQKKKQHVHYYVKIPCERMLVRPGESFLFPQLEQISESLYNTVEVREEGKGGGDLI